MKFFCNSIRSISDRPLLETTLDLVLQKQGQQGGVAQSENHDDRQRPLHFGSDPVRKEERKEEINSKGHASRDILFQEGNTHGMPDNDGTFFEYPEFRRKKIRRDKILSSVFSVKSGLRRDKIPLPASLQLAIFLIRKAVHKSGMERNGISGGFVFQMFMQDIAEKKTQTQLMKQEQGTQKEKRLETGRKRY